MISCAHRIETARGRYLDRQTRPHRSGGQKALAAALVIGALLALGACRSGGGTGAGSGDLAVRPGSAPVAGETLGTGQVRVALLAPLSATGNAGQIGPNLKNAAALAIREFQTANIQVLVKDDGGTPEGARVATAQAIAEGAELILGPFFATSVGAAAAVAKPSRVPVVAFSTDAASASRGVYTLGFLPQSDVDRIVSYAASQGKRSIAALLPNTTYGTLVEAALQRAVGNAGGRVMTVARYELDRVSMQEKATQVAALAKSGTIDAIFMPDAGDVTPFLAQILAANGARSDRIKFLGSSQWDDPRISAESNLAGAWFPGADNTGFQSFARRYQAAFGAPPNRKATMAYDATSLAAGLTARFGNDRFSDQTLTNPSGFIGIDGAFRLLANGLNERGLAVYEIEAGAAKVISPAPKSFAKSGA
jgi:hypothetical protein